MTTEDHPFVCPTCAWRGTENELDCDYSLFGEYTEKTCPKCSTVLQTVRNYVTAEEAQQQADAGNAWLQQAISYRSRIEQSQLKSLDQFPELADRSELELVWECVNIPEEGRQESVWIIIRLSTGEPIWRERSYYGNQARFSEMKELLTLKYGDRFKSLERDCSDHLYTSLYWYGD
ncbi:hypothetical protein [Larkinella humicola]|uniref:Uncharacterized protein n=1 Tax=Larkinella humicola TaxID=2607654 RepID=A0A5N1JIG4_9BACT|nr:hypothetical protein [Larkinella humicola]KAA9356230.1 hypothetical protein F0P93_00300 [Larkinella humicola]